MSEAGVSTLTLAPPGAAPYEFEVSTGWNRLLSAGTISRCKASSVFLITQLGLESIEDSFLKGSGLALPPERIVRIGQGEAAKHINVLGPIFNQLIRAGIDRNSLILALGGGVVGDLAGFVVATILRGVRFAQLPTTLLAAVDSSVGGKVAVNVDGGKNMVGAFYQPVFVYFNQSLLASLPESEWICGLAEMFKHGLIEESGRVLTNLRASVGRLRTADSPDLRAAVLDSVAVKAGVVEQDVRENGLRAVLNLGHTTAHAIESATAHRRFSHGAAVSRGLATMLLLSRDVLGLPPGETEDLLAAMESFALPRDTAGLSAAELLEHMRFDKKTVAGVPKFVLLERRGRPIFGQDVSEEQFQQAWSEQAERFGAHE